ncbi:response regulator transcription factor [Vitiosangium sp. GDMCC 1.1324]|uniref:response regulator transcription factor n=1 Tax=Vitiosangium sp. (strain GDMCC 1.1324) TaxID=2138576 RepID=UPI000D3828CA|nr:response regulator [Vitiosangium sp. GDMCC 1.1324]PTL84951.1 two-component system response regulator [Vitiosangium sp. GDMCC 1.1324]
MGGETPSVVLLVDDDGIHRERLGRAFERRGFRVYGASDARGALAGARELGPSHAVVDLRLPDGSGLEVVRELKALDERMCIVVLTGYGSIATAVEAVRRGATHYLSKPADVDDILLAFAGSTIAAGEQAALTHQVPSLARAEWEHIQRVLADCGGNISQAARLLRIQRRSLQRKLAKHPVSR